MTTFTQWLEDQRKREDAVGWFARYWKDLDGRPRLSSPSSIAQHLEDREAPGGFRDPAITLSDGSTCTGNQLRQAYDMTLKEYRDVRAQIVQAAVPGAQGQQDPLPGMETPQEPAQGLAGQAVARAAAAGLAAAQAAQDRAIAGQVLAEAGNVPLMLQLILAKLERIEEALGLAEPLPWDQWYEQAAVYASAHRDEPEE